MGVLAYRVEMFPLSMALYFNATTVYFLVMSRSNHRCRSVNANLTASTDASVYLAVAFTLFMALWLIY